MPDTFEEDDLEVILLSAKCGALTSVTKVTKVASGNFIVQLASEKGCYI